MPDRKNKRKRTAEDDDRIGSGTKAAKRAQPKDQLGSLPTELFQRVLGEVALAEDDRQSVRSLAAVEMLSQAYQAKLLGSPAQRYRVSMTEAHEAAKEIYGLLPGGGESGEAAATMDDVPATAYVRALGPGLRYLSSGEQANFVEFVLQVEDGSEKAYALDELALHSGDLNENKRSRLLESAISLLQDTTGMVRLRAGKAIARLHGHLSPEGKARVADIRTYDPNAAEMIDGEIDALERMGSPTVAYSSRQASYDGGQPTLMDRLTIAGCDLQAKQDQVAMARKSLENSMDETNQGAEARRNLRNSVRERSGRA
ncbi:hypothetical protein AGR4C_pa50025 [Agrobacterium tumefaciens str. Kerr 14]|uniref:Uncharacterized protein n=1 Tax=Agrobacterium tumefaciens str. Kerr 14 TaxID=1183424 RepID=A0A1S7SB30_AGRTU|nr:hypothetical protein [Agrobacterium tumefaciens]CUX65459.1 hypothetical protein AGR4C_pa50025 [Agrobacterium tumefaciens str. Kerr 14]